MLPLQIKYTTTFNESFIRLMLQHKGQVSERPLRLMCHIVNAHEIWNSRLMKQSAGRGVWEVQPLEALLQQNAQNQVQTLKLLEELPCDSRVTYTTTKGAVFENTLQDIVFHIVNHSTYHRGQVASALKAATIEPPASDYIFYRRESL